MCSTTKFFCSSTKTKSVQHENRIARFENIPVWEFAPNLHQNRKLGKKKTPKTVVVSGFFDNRPKAELISWRTGLRDERP